MNVTPEIIQWLLSALVTAGVAGAGAFWRFYTKVAKPTMERLEKMDCYMDKVDRIYQEVTPNGGASLKDQVGRIKVLLTLSEAKDRVQSELDNRPMFETDQNGDFIWINRAFCRLSGYSQEELLDQGWKNFVFPEDLRTVTNSWHLAIEDEREYHQTYRVLSQQGVTIKVMVQASPLVDSQRKLLGYLGQLTAYPQN